MADDTLTLRLGAVSDGGFAPDIVESFGRWVATAPEDELFRVPVLQWAKDRDLDEDQAVDLFLHATRAGIFDMTWGIVCSTCAMLVTTPGGLRSLGKQAFCGL